MRFEVVYPADAWSVMPRPDAHDDEPWVADQAAAWAAGPLVGLADRLQVAARQALLRRRAGIDTSLFFRPVGIPVTGVLHAALRTVPPAAAEAAATGSPEWMLPEVALQSDPVVEDFETEHVPRGRRVAFVTTEPDGSGATLAGIAYGLVWRDMIGLVFSELAHREAIGAMQLHADPLVGSLRVAR